MAKETEVGPRGKEAPKEVSRREFVKGAALGAAAAVGAGALASCAAPTPEVIKETVEVPVEVTRVVEKELEVPPKEVTLEVLDPRGEVFGYVEYEMAPRLADLNGKTIGLMGDWLTGHGSVDFPMLKQYLSAQFTDVKFIEWSSETPVPLTEEGLAEILGPAKECDAVIGFSAL